MSQITAHDPILFKVQRAIIAVHGTGGLKKAVQTFRAAQRELDGAALPPKTFFDLLVACGAPALNDREQKHLFMSFDDDKSGTVSVNEFVRHLTSALNPRRQKLLRKVFQATGNGSTDTLGSTHSSQQGTGQKPAAWDAEAFAATFGNDLSESQTIAYEEFLAFYTALSLQKSMTDDDFELALLREWGADESASPILNETNRDWQSQGGNPLAIAAPIHVKDTLRKFEAPVPSLRTYNNEHASRTMPPNPPLPAEILPDYITTTARSYPKYNTQQLRASDPFGFQSK